MKKRKNIFKTAVRLGLEKYFWDVSFNNDLFIKYPQFVIERIGKLGDFKAVAFMYLIYGKQYCKKIIQKSSAISYESKQLFLG